MTISSDPVPFGLVQVARIEYSDSCYCFDTRIVWRETNTGRLLTAKDSGCSCPTPFEGLEVKDLQELGEFVIHEAQGKAGTTYYAGEPIGDFVAKVKELLDLEKPKEPDKFLEVYQKYRKLKREADYLHDLYIEALGEAHSAEEEWSDAEDKVKDLVKKYPKLAELDKWFNS